MKLTAIAAFSWAHRGVEVKTYELGEEIDTDDEDLIEVSQREGWTAGAKTDTGTHSAPAPVDEPAAEDEPKALAVAPENKASKPKSKK